MSNRRGKAVTSVDAEEVNAGKDATSRSVSNRRGKDVASVDTEALNTVNNATSCSASNRRGRYVARVDTEAVKTVTTTRSSCQSSKPTGGKAAVQAGTDTTAKSSKASNKTTQVMNGEASEKVCDISRSKKACSKLSMEQKDEDSDGIADRLLNVSSRRRPAVIEDSTDSDSEREISVTDTVEVDVISWRQTRRRRDPFRYNFTRHSG